MLEVVAVGEALQSSMGAGLFCGLPRRLGSAVGGMRSDGCGGGEASGGGAEAAPQWLTGDAASSLVGGQGKDGKTAYLTSALMLLQRLGWQRLWVWRRAPELMSPAWRRKGLCSSADQGRRGSNQRRMTPDHPLPAWIGKRVIGLRCVLCLLPSSETWYKLCSSMVVMRPLRSQR